MVRDLNRHYSPHAVTHVIIFLPGIENLPFELQRNFQLMRDLDQRTEGECGNDLDVTLRDLYTSWIPTDWDLSIVYNSYSPPLTSLSSMNTWRHWAWAS